MKAFCCIRFGLLGSVLLLAACSQSNNPQPNELAKAKAWSSPQVVFLKEGLVPGQPSIAMDDQGQAMALWFTRIPDQRYMTSTARYVPGSGWEAPLNWGNAGTTAQSPSDPQIACPPNGNFTGIWTYENAAWTAIEIYASAPDTAHFTSSVMPSNERLIPGPMCSDGSGALLSVGSWIRQDGSQTFGVLRFRPNWGWLFRPLPVLGSISPTPPIGCLDGQGDALLAWLENTPNGQGLKTLNWDLLDNLLPNPSPIPPNGAPVQTAALGTLTGGTGVALWAIPDGSNLSYTFKPRGGGWSAAQTVPLPEGELQGLTIASNPWASVFHAFLRTGSHNQKGQLVHLLGTSTLGTPRILFSGLEPGPLVVAANASGQAILVVSGGASTWKVGHLSLDGTWSPSDLPAPGHTGVPVLALSRTGEGVLVWRAVDAQGQAALWASHWK